MAGAERCAGLLRALARSQPAASCSGRPFSASAGVDEVFDVVVVGGGLVGSAVAAALRSNKWTEGLRVAVLDRQAPPQESTPLPEVPGLRVSTVTPSSVQLLREIADWQDVEPPRSAAFSSMQVWDQGGHGCVRYHASDVGQAVIGYVAENLVLHTALLRSLSRPGAQPVFQPPAVLEELVLPEYTAAKGTGGVGLPLAELRLAGGRALRARLVVGADGGRSQVRTLAGLRTVAWPYHQRGLVATVATAGGNVTAHQRFLDTGPLALLPVRGGHSNVVWSTTPQRAEALAELGPRKFAAAVNEALQGGSSPSSGGFEPPPTVTEAVGPRPQSFPLVFCHAGRYVRPRLALVGDAAHSVHPLAGQGVNLGFQDVRALTDTLAHAAECGRDPGELSLLQEHYEAPRQRSNLAMMAALDGLSRLYKPQAGPVAAARGLGLSLVNAVPGAKQRIMRYAMGL